MSSSINNEKDWLTCKQPSDMVNFLREHFRSSRKKFGQRKARLFVVACCRHVWPQFKDDRARHAIEVLELYADGKASPQELQAAEAAAADVDKGFVMALGIIRNVRTRTKAQIGHQSKRPLPVWLKAELATSIPALTAGHPRSVGSEERHLANLLRDIFGNPFSAVTLDRACQTSEVVALAQSIYDDRDFGKLQTLAKALRDSGCVDKAVLNHCRTKGPHVRGCWVVDLVLSGVRSRSK